MQPWGGEIEGACSSSSKQVLQGCRDFENLHCRGEKKWLDKELHDLHSSLFVISMIESLVQQWARNVHGKTKMYTQ